ncbi:DinB family protein [Amycolatopsis sp. FBCC-B4732]|uniref:DinB family protein n=1 Tax=Amycolatopsis sp. FBCC-B4732 TaxID=3079339 RepID=UPI0028F451D7|nr:DinB family protein [Amycolatopsis sp. FBCC-B4732]
MDRRPVHEQWDQDRAAVHEPAATAELRRPSAGTRWTNGQPVFHLVFGYQIVRAVLVLVRVFGRLPDSVSRRFAAAWLDHIIASLHRSLERAAEADLGRGMHYPDRWDPSSSRT